MGKYDIIIMIIQGGNMNLNGLNDKEVSAILVNESVYSLIKTDLAYLGIKVKDLDTVQIL